MADVINFRHGRHKNRESFDQVTGIQREDLLMETAMRVQEVFDDMFYARLLDYKKVEESDPIERFQLFKYWAREFENKYHGTEEYDTDFWNLSDDFFIEKMQPLFGNGQPAIRTDFIPDDDEGR